MRVLGNKKGLLGSCLRAMALFVVTCTLMASPQNAQAQRGLGMRFGSDFNHFFRAENHPLVDGWWSHMVFGFFYQAYFDDGGAQIGLNILYKGNTGRGFPNMPVIQNDFADGQNLGLTALEFDFKAGPRFGLINPKLGMLMSYRLRQDGFLEAGQTDAINRFNFQFPIGLSVEGPTGYGSVGFSVFYEIGLNNVLKNPTPKKFQDFDGSKLRALNLELYVLFSFGDQKRKPPANVPPPID